MHAWHLRRLSDLPAAGRGVVIDLHVRRLSCDNAACPQKSVQQQIPELAPRYARRTQRLTVTLAQMAITLAGRAGAGVLARLGVRTSRSTMLRLLMALAIPSASTPRVLSVDDVTLRHQHRYATVVIDADTHRRVDVLPDRKAATLTEWLREHLGAEIVCREGSASYAEAIPPGRTRRDADQRPMAAVARAWCGGGEHSHRPRQLLAGRPAEAGAGHRRTDPRSARSSA